MLTLVRIVIFETLAYNNIIKIRKELNFHDPIEICECGEELVHGMRQQKAQHYTTNGATELSVFRNEMRYRTRYRTSARLWSLSLE